MMPYFFSHTGSGINNVWLSQSDIDYANATRLSFLSDK